MYVGYFFANKGGGVVADKNYMVYYYPFNDSNAIFGFSGS